jgi:hypothetical protein
MNHYSYILLTIDTLGRLINCVMELGVLQQLHPRRHIPEISLYTDDVVLLCHPTSNDLASVKAILQLFGRSSGLLVNYNKARPHYYNVNLTTRQGSQMH